MCEYNDISDKRIAFALTGSFCVFDKVLPEIKKMTDLGISVLPVFSETVYNTDTRFYDSKQLVDDVYSITGKFPIHTVVGAEPIGPKNLADLIVVAPCTGNTMAKMANGIVDSCVLMAVKAVHRNGGKIIIAISSNDALKTNAINLGKLLAMKNVYFVPFGQDDCDGKPTSLVADMSKIMDTCAVAENNKQIQPMLIS